MFETAITLPLSGWGRYPVRNSRLARVDAPHDLSKAALAGAGELLARGLGRSYGDASIGTQLTLDMLGLDRLRSFDPATGELECEAGLSLKALLDFLVPRGWFPPVTPGTQFVTLGGMVASDVHGKNHQAAGSFASHVLHLDLAMGEGSLVRCSPAVEPELFWATCGGMGLTGVIVSVRLRCIPIESAWFVQTTRRAAGLDETLALLDAAASSTYSVAWIDCLAQGASLGRSAVTLGEHAALSDLDAMTAQQALCRQRKPAKTLPVDLPGAALNQLTVRAFNEIYYRAQREGRRVVALEPYFYPLDAVLHWNRLYGSRGFVQYQCVLPPDTGPEALHAMLTTIAKSGLGSFLAVLKKLGAENAGLLSFPMPGYTLALDFPATADAFALLNQLDNLLVQAKGRLYLAKDARASSRVIEAGYPRIETFRQLRRQWGLDRRFKSVLSERLGL